jgi:hypothetical protein
MMTMTIRGAEQVLRRMTRLGEEMPAAVGRALFRFASVDIEAPAKQRYAPVVTGSLRSSIHTEQPVVTRRGASVIVGAGGAAAPYAAYVHENPRSGRTGGFSPSGRRYKRWSRVGQWKYLETPALEAARDGSGFAREMGAELEKVLRGLR